jgi:hypothetical protein
MIEKEVTLKFILKAKNKESLDKGIEQLCEKLTAVGICVFELETEEEIIRQDGLGVNAHN